jgi:hypothetical protein
MQVLQNDRTICKVRAMDASPWAYDVDGSYASHASQLQNGLREWRCRVGMVMYVKGVHVLNGEVRIRCNKAVDTHHAMPRLALIAMYLNAC